MSDGTERTDGGAERPNDGTERTDGRTERPTGSTERTDGRTERPNDGTERTDGRTERPTGSTERTDGRTEPPSGSTERTDDSTERTGGGAGRSNGRTGRSNAGAERTNGSAGRTNGGNGMPWRPDGRTGRAGGGERPLVVVGDVLLDRDIDGDADRLAPDAPAPVVEVRTGRSRPGGAGLAAVLAARHGRPVVLVTALGGDRASRQVRDALRPRISRLVELPLRGTLPVKTRIRARGRTLLRLDHGAGRPEEPDRGTLAAVRQALGEAAAVLVSDYGRGVAGVLRPLLTHAARGGLLVWDPHPRGDPPVPGTRLATPNAAEADTFAAAAGGSADERSLRGHALRGARLAEHWQAAAVAVTLGGRGALLTRGGDSPMLIPVERAVDGDSCGAGDCFAAAATAALAAGALPEEAVRRAVADATAFVAAGEGPWPGGRGPGLPEPGRGPADPFALAESVRARGGTVVAAGGCFDLLHAGHVGLLESARRIGDCLVVCLNSDASVARLKGPGRPLMPQADRARVLMGLGCVDAVAVFGDDTPDPLLRRLRPDVWVKGGDYTADALPEAAALREWGGQALVLPYLDGRSTTELARRAARPSGPRG